MADLKAVRNGIETRMDTISGLRHADGMVNPPAYAVVLATPGTEFHQAYQDGLTDWTFSVVVYVSTAFNRTARDELDAYCDVTGSKSVKQAIEGDAKLGGIVHDLIVRTVTQGDFIMRESSTSGSGSTTHAYVGAEFTVEVHGA